MVGYPCHVFMKLKMKSNLWISDLDAGTGTLKYYDYYVSGIKVKSKSAVYEAIQLKIATIIRKEKADGTLAHFNYKTLRFEEKKEVA